jgi:hypothetical protein
MESTGYETSKHIRPPKISWNHPNLEAYEVFQRQMGEGAGIVPDGRTAGEKLGRGPQELAWFAAAGSGSKEQGMC